jgi:hypothetical protein
MKETDRSGGGDFCRGGELWVTHESHLCAHLGDRDDATGERPARTDHYVAFSDPVARPAINDHQPLPNLKVARHHLHRNAAERD